MIKNKSTLISPVVLFVLILAVFELAVRLPYIYFLDNASNTSTFKRLHFFSYYNPEEVIFYGALIVSLLVMLVGAIAMVLRPTYRPESVLVAFPTIPKSIYSVGIAFILIGVFAVLLLGADALDESVSGKREELGERGIVWLLMRVSVFSHMIAILFYIRASQTGRKVDKVAFVISILVVAIPAVVFSVRAIIVSLILELIYVQMLLGNFNLKQVLKSMLFLFPVLLLISILRPSAQDLSLIESVVFGFEKVLQSRYFFDVGKLGVGTLWAADQQWLGPVSIAFLFEFFSPDTFIYYKEIGPILAQELYYISTGGVTPGGLLESVISFGLLGGVLFFAASLLVFIRLERRLLRDTNISVLKILFFLLVLSKFSLFVNSSLGAFTFQLVFESFILIIVVFALGLIGKKVHRGNVGRWNSNYSGRR